MNKILSIFAAALLITGCVRLDAEDINIDEGRKEGHKENIRTHQSDQSDLFHYNGYEHNERIKCAEGYWRDTHSYKKILFFDKGECYITEKAVCIVPDKGEYFVRPLVERPFGNKGVEEFKRMCGRFIYRTKKGHLFFHDEFYIKADSMMFFTKQELDEMIKNHVHPAMKLLSCKK